MSKTGFIVCVCVIYAVIILIDAFFKSPKNNWFKYSDIVSVEICNTTRETIIENKDSFYENHHGGWNTSNILSQNVSVQINITIWHEDIGTKTFTDKCLTKECIDFYMMSIKIDVFTIVVYDNMFTIHDEHRLYEVEPSDDSIVNHRNRYIFIGLAPFIGFLGLILTYGFLCCLCWSCKETFKSIKYKIENRDIIFNNVVVKNKIDTSLTVV